MPWIKITEPSGAQGLLKKLYDDAIKRAGKIFNIVSIMSPNPRSLKCSLDFYGALMKGRSSLSRAQREMLATVVSSVNHCKY